MGKSCSLNPDFCMPLLAERDTMRNYCVQMKCTALRGALDSSITFESCLAAVDGPVCDNSTGWVQAQIKVGSLIFQLT